MPPDPSNCPFCNPTARRLFSVQGEVGRHVFDSDRARQIAEDGRGIHLVHRALLDRLLSVNNDFSEEHLAHVNMDHPGVIGHHFGGVILIAGTHEAIRAKRENMPFYAHMLTFSETQSCLVDPVQFTPAMIAREIQGLLHHNILRQPLLVDVLAKADESRQATEAAIRRVLQQDENDNILLVFHDPQPK